MEKQDTAALLVQDLGANMTYLQISAFMLTIVLALIGLSLAFKAYTVLSEARALYWRASDANAPARLENETRAARAAAIRSSQSFRKKLPGGKKPVL